MYVLLNLQQDYDWSCVDILCYSESEESLNEFKEFIESLANCEGDTADEVRSKEMFIRDRLGLDEFSFEDLGLSVEKVNEFKVSPNGYSFDDSSKDFYFRKLNLERELKKVEKELHNLNSKRKMDFHKEVSQHAHYELGMEAKLTTKINVDNTFLGYSISEVAQKEKDRIERDMSIGQIINSKVFKPGNETATEEIVTKQTVTKEKLGD